MFLHFAFVILRLYIAKSCKKIKEPLDFLMSYDEIK